MSRVPREIALWNKFVRTLMAAERNWEALQEIMANRPRTDFELFSPKAQKFLSKGFIKAKFNIMLPRVIDYWRSIGGLEELLIPFEEKSDGGTK